MPHFTCPRRKNAGTHRNLVLLCQHGFLIKGSNPTSGVGTIEKRLGIAPVTLARRVLRENRGVATRFVFENSSGVDNFLIVSTAEIGGTSLDNGNTANVDGSVAIAVSVDFPCNPQQGPASGVSVTWLSDQANVNLAITGAICSSIQWRTFSGTTGDVISISAVAFSPRQIFITGAR